MPQTLHTVARHIICTDKLNNQTTVRWYLKADNSLISEYKSKGRGPHHYSNSCKVVREILNIPFVFIEGGHNYLLQQKVEQSLSNEIDMQEKAFQKTERNEIRQTEAIDMAWENSLDSCHN